MSHIASRSQTKTRLIILLILGATLFAYWQASHFDFVDYDDPQYITANSHVSSGLTWANVSWARTAVVQSNWHPLTMLSHMLDCQLFGLNPAGHHLTSLFFHIANIVLLYWVLLRMTGSVGRSAAVAALFALHPLNVDSVAWIAERKNVLSTFFMLLTLGAYVRSVRTPGLWNTLLVLPPFVLGLLSKPMIVTLPCLLLLLDVWPLKRLDTPTAGVQEPTASVKRMAMRLVLQKAPLFLLALVIGIVAIKTQHDTGAMNAGTHMPGTVRLANATVAYCAYLAKMIWPANLAVFYPHPGTSLPSWQVLSAAIFLIAATGFAFWKARRFPYLIVGWLWYVITLLPVIGLLQVGEQAMADRYAYVPLIGIFLIIAWGAVDAWNALRLPRSGPIAVAGCLMVVMALATRNQVSYWRNSETLFSHAIDATQNNYVAEAGLGMALLTGGRTDDAIAHLTKSITINPKYDKGQGDLGLAFARIRNYHEAITHYQLALEITPTSRIYSNLGSALSGLGRYDEAIAAYNHSLQIQPDFAIARYNLGIAFEGAHRYKDAMTQYVEVMLAQPNNSRVQIDLGKLLMHHPELAEDLTKQLNPAQLQPYIQLFNDLAMSAANHGKFDDAARDYQSTLTLDPANEDAKRNLGRLMLRRSTMP